VTTPVPPQAPRTDAAGRLRREIWHARNVGEHALADELQARLNALPTSPQPETTAAAPPARETTSRTRSRRPDVPRR
jgi:hypothetical protein